MMAKTVKKKVLIGSRKGTNLRVAKESGKPEAKGTTNTLYTPTAEDAATAREERGSRMWKPAEGRSVVVVLPPTVASGLKMPWITSSAHYIGGKDVLSVLGIDRPDDLPMAHACSKEMRGTRCLWCEKLAELQKSKSKRDKKLAKALWPSRENFVNLVDMAAPKSARVGKLAQTVIDELRDAIEDGHNFCDPANLRKVTIRRKGQGMGTKYKASVLPDSVGKIRSAWVATMTDLSSVTPAFPDDDEVQEAMDLLFESAAGSDEVDLGLDGDFGADDDIPF